MSERPEERHVDGNALAGPLAELLGVDLSGALTRCVGCRRQWRVAELRVYLGGPGSVARCPGCDSVVARLSRTAHAAYLDLRGTVALEIPLGEPAGAASG